MSKTVQRKGIPKKSSLVYLNTIHFCVVSTILHNFLPTRKLKTYEIPLSEVKCLWDKVITSK